MPPGCELSLSVEPGSLVPACLPRSTPPVSKSVGEPGRLAWVAALAWSDPDRAHRSASVGIETLFQPLNGLCC